MSSIVFVTWDGGGNLPPMLAVAGELSARGHFITFLAHPGQERTVRDAGLAFSAYSEANTGLRELSLFADRGHGTDVLRWVEQNRPDLVIVDCFLFGVMETLMSAGRQYAVFVHLFDGYLRPALRGPFGIVLRLKGVRGLRVLNWSIGTVATSWERLDPQRDHVVHVGPVTGGVPSIPSSPPTVLLSLSTYPYRHLTDLWQELFDAVEGMPIRAIATLGPHVTPEQLTIPDSVEVHEWLPHHAVMPSASLVVTHGGHGTAMTALAHGVPVLILPLDLRTDQSAVGRAIQAAGAGRLISRRSTPDRIRLAITDLLTDGFAQAAANLGAELRALDGPRAGADAYESMLDPSVP